MGEEPDMKTIDVYCPLCDAVVVNGTPTHEAECPNSSELWVLRSIGRDPENRKQHRKVYVPDYVGVPEWMAE